jgi:hypothetical protein
MGTKDLALELVCLGNNPNANLVPSVRGQTLTWNTIVKLGVHSLAVQIDNTGTYKLPGTQMQSFTTMGFGETGDFSVVGGVNTWTETVNSAGTKRFQNNVTSGTTQQDTIAGYTYDSVQWHPQFGMGQGAILPIDSGSPLLSSNAMNYTVQPSGPTINNVFTDNIFGVATATSGLPNLTAADGQLGVLLTPPDVTWIMKSCAALQASVPEPGAWIMCATGIGIVFLAARRGRSGPGLRTHGQARLN